MEPARDESRFAHFNLVLMVTQACNLACTYCYRGKAGNARLPAAYARAAVDRALRSLRPAGTLCLGFFGGEPLLEAGLVREILGYARAQAERVGVRLQAAITTNGTQTHAEAWEVMLDPDLALAVSHDGLPRAHDRFRRTPAGRGTSARALASIKNLLAAGRDIHAVMVVRPETLQYLPLGIQFLTKVGVRHLEPTIDLWAGWQDKDLAALRPAIARAADLWQEGLPERSIGWFDEKAARLAGVPIHGCTRCGFGHGEVTVSCAGHLYPCERLVADDAPGNPHRLPGGVLEGEDFLHLPRPSASRPAACARCAIAELCTTTCRCANLVRTGDPQQPDRLLCELNKACAQEAARVLNRIGLVRPRTQEETRCTARSA